MTTITITDPELLKQLAGVSGTVEVRDAAGTLVGQFQQRNPGALPSGVKSPIAEEELERRRKNLTGKPLSEIIQRLESGQK